MGKRSKKEKPRWLQKIEYLGYRLGLMLLRCLPRSYGEKLAKWLGDLFFLFDQRHYKVAYDNLSQSNLGLPLSMYDTFIRQTYHQMFLLLWDAVVMRIVIRPANVDQFIHWNQLPQVKNELKNHPSVISVTGHLGNWEVLGGTLGLKGIQLNTVARPFGNQYIEEHIRQERGKYGQNIICKTGAVQESIGLLKKNQSVTFLVDQNAGSSGEFVEFFGRPASTFSVAASLAYRFNRPIYLGFAIRDPKRFFFDVYLDGPIFPDLNNPREKEVKRLTQLYTSAIETRIRQYPTQWLWFHRRWKTAPPPVLET